MSKLTEKWKTIRINKENHEKLNFLALYHNKKLAQMIEIFIKKEYEKEKEKIKESL